MARKPAGASDAREIPDDILGLSFEQAIQALEEIVEKLEGGEVGLETSIEMYSRGTLLKRHCEQKLRTAGEQVDRIVVGASGEAVGTEPAEIE